MKKKVFREQIHSAKKEKKFWYQGIKLTQPNIDVNVIPTFLNKPYELYNFF